MENIDQKQITGAIIIAGMLIAGAILLKGSGPADNGKIPQVAENPDETNFADAMIRPISIDEHLLGNPSAEVVVVEYSDTECPFCKKFHSTMHQIVKENNGKVAWAYRHYPIPELHAKAFREAEATECAWEQGGNNSFWEYIDELYVRTNSNDSLADSELPKIAKDIGLDVASFNECLESEQFFSKVQSDIEDGDATGVNGTPSSFILKDGEIIDNIPGAQPIEIVREKIEQALR